jgi:hypothetical protein
MKTPREILFERHRQAGPKLDAIRRNVLGTRSASEEALASGPLEIASTHKRSFWLHEALSRLKVGAPFFVRKAWLELILPSPRAWAGMATVWLAVLAANFLMKAPVPGSPGPGSAPAREVAQALEEQRRLLAELLPPAKPALVEAPPVQAPPPNPRPRSEGSVPFKAC